MGYPNLFGDATRKGGQWWMPLLGVRRFGGGDDEDAPPGETGGGGIFSGADPRNPPIMRLSGDDGFTFGGVSDAARERTQELLRRPQFTGGTPAPDPETAFRPDPLRTPLSMSRELPLAADDPLTREVQTPPGRLDFDRARMKRGLPPKSESTGDPRRDAIAAREALLNNRNPKDTNGRGRSTLKGALEGFARGLATSGLGGGVGGAVTGAVRGGFAPNWDERLGRDREAGRLTQNIATGDAEEKRRLEGEETRSQTNLRDAQTEYTKTTKVEEARAREEDRQKRQLLSMLRSIPSIDPTRHKVFLDKWRQTFGEDFDVDAYNNKKSNFVIRGLITDPSKPQEKHDVAINFADNSTRDLGRSGYSVVLDAQGMS